jgi:IS30 family transposase
MHVYLMTDSNGFEFARRQFVCELLGACGSSCQLYHLWKNSGYENFDGLVPRYFRKGSNFFNVSEAGL